MTWTDYWSVIKRSTDRVIPKTTRITDESPTTTDELQTTKDESQTNAVEPQSITGNMNYGGVFSAVNMV